MGIRERRFYKLYLTEVVGGEGSRYCLVFKEQ